MKKKIKEEETSEMITRAAALEKFFNRSFNEIMSLRQFGLPIKNRGGFPTLLIAEFNDWKVENEIADIEPGKITTQQLFKNLERRRILGRENVELIGVNAIAEAFNMPPYKVELLFRDYPGCPIRRVDRILRVGKIDLNIWLRDNQVCPYGAFPGETTR